jgi:uncharacterized membrane protein YhaH (DUF805 family)
MASAFLPSTLTRKQYVIRWLIVFAVVVAAMFFYVGAPTGTPVEIAGVIFGVVVLLAFLYNIFGLSIPRLRNARISLWALLLLLIPGGPLWMFILCVAAREK